MIREEAVPARVRLRIFEAVAVALGHATHSTRITRCERLNEGWAF